jgi:hypothetical protein
VLPVFFIVIAPYYFFRFDAQATRYPASGDRPI